MTPEREAAIVRLLETQDDNLPGIVRRDATAAGFAHEQRPRTCPDCLANGRAIIGCETCGGSGVVSVPRLGLIAAPDTLPDDGTSTDPYANRGGFFDGGAQHDRSAMIEQAIAAAGRDLRRFPGFRPQSLADEIAEANQHPPAWWRARQAMYRDYDYAALARALEQMHSEHPGVSAYSDLGITFLDERLPDPLRAPGAAPPTEPRVIAKLERAAGTTAIEVRNARIVAMASEGASPSEIAAACHVSVVTAYRILRNAAA